MAVTTGEILAGKYELREQIGAGGSGVVYLAWDRHLERYVAVKAEKRPEETERADILKKEMEMLKALKHPMLPAIYDYFQETERYLVMEYIEGESLHNFIRKEGSIPEKQVYQWALQLSDLLSYLHAQKPPVIYRDLKPDNIILCPDGNLRVIDFGAALRVSYDRRKTQQPAGTIGYASPEQLAGATGYASPERLAGAADYASPEQLAGAADCVSPEQLAGAADYASPEQLVCAADCALPERPEGTADCALPERPEGTADCALPEQLVGAVGCPVPGKLFGRNGYGDRTGEGYRDGYGAGADERSDIYTLGATLYHMLTGHNPAMPPYGIRPVRCMRPELTRDMEWIVEKCTEEDPSKRYQTVEELRKDLERQRFSGRRRLRGIGRRKQDVLRRVEKQIWLTEKKTIGLFAAGFLLCGLFAGLFSIQVKGRETPLPVIVYNKQGQKLVIRYDSIYRPEGNLLFELEQELFGGNGIRELSIGLTDCETGERRERLFYIQGSGIEEGK